MNDSITVLTPTRGRCDLIRRCINSVKQQEYDGEIRHLILIDDCPQTEQTLRQWEQPNKSLNWVLRDRSSTEHSGPEHLAKLRNFLVEMAQTQWIAFLDDDNEYEPEHLRQLVECAHQTKSQAVHSWLKLYNFDGSPYLNNRWPWCREEKYGELRYQEMLKKNVISSGSNIVRDSISNLPNRCVDTSEWLIDRQVLLEHPISSDFSYEEWQKNKAEDDKLLIQLLASNVTITCNKKATVKYYLGGYSNNHDGDHDHSEVWQWRSSESFEELRKIDI